MWSTAKQLLNIGDTRGNLALKFADGLNTLIVIAAEVDIAVETSTFTSYELRLLLHASHHRRHRDAHGVQHADQFAADDGGCPILTLSGAKGKGGDFLS